MDHCKQVKLVHLGGHSLSASLGDVTTLLPSFATDKASHNIMDFIYVALVRYDKNLKLTDWAARSHEILDNGAAIRFTPLRDDIRWIDGNAHRR